MDVPDTILHKITTLQSIPKKPPPDSANNAIEVINDLYTICENYYFANSSVASAVDAQLQENAILTIMKLLKRTKNWEEVVSVDLKNGLRSKCIRILCWLAYGPKDKQTLVDAGAMRHFVYFLKMHKSCVISETFVELLSITASAIRFLAYANTNFQEDFRTEGAATVLFELLTFNDLVVQKEAGLALQVLSFENHATKHNIVVECNGLPTIIFLLQSKDPSIHHMAVFLMMSLAHSSPDIPRLVVDSGALQPLIRLLSSSCWMSRREASRFLGVLAEFSAPFKAQIAQRGAIKPLVDMIKTLDEQLCSESVWTLRKLATNDPANQACIGYSGGIDPLINLLWSKSRSIRYHAGHALVCLAENEDNVEDFIKALSFQKLLCGRFECQDTKEIALTILKRLKEKMHGQVFKHLLYLMGIEDRSVRRRIAAALAHLCSLDDCKTIFVVNHGLELLLDLLKSSIPSQLITASVALLQLATKAAVSPMDVVSATGQVLRGEENLNNPANYDVVFLVEGQKFYAHRDCLTVSSEVFCAMLAGGFKESGAEDEEIPIQDIKWDVFESMMRFIYTDQLNVNLSIALDLLKVADQFLLDGLKCQCEKVISAFLSLDNVVQTFNLSGLSRATRLRDECIMFVLKQIQELSPSDVKPSHYNAVHSMLAAMPTLFMDLLTRA